MYHTYLEGLAIGVLDEFLVSPMVSPQENTQNLNVSPKVFPKSPKLGMIFTSHFTQNCPHLAPVFSRRNQVAAASESESEPEDLGCFIWMM
jgi:hypothetical protein